MNREILFGALALAAFFAATTAGATDTMDLDPVMAAKVAKEKAKAGAGAASQGKSLSSDKTTVSGVDDCGVNIGNVDTGKAGTKGVAGPRENNVIITGPVINLGKCKK